MANITCGLRKVLLIFSKPCPSYNCEKLKRFDLLSDISDDLPLKNKSKFYRKCPTSNLSNLVFDLDLDATLSVLLIYLPRLCVVLVCVLQNHYGHLRKYIRKMITALIKL